jgi:hypothetical protein
VILDDESLARMFGSEDAENEDPARLKEYFFKNKAYESLRANLPIRLVYGHKGVGKSALLKMSFLEDAEEDILSIWLTPSDLAEVLKVAGDDFNGLVALWRRELQSKILEKIWAYFGTDVSADVALARNIATGKEIIDFVSNVFKEKGKDALIASKQKIVDKFYSRKNIRVYIDDLDRGWQAKHSDITKISALLTAVRDLCGADNNLQVRIALRTDVYYLVRTSDESTDKIEQHLIPLQWSNQDILVVVAKRVSTFFGRTYTDAQWDQKTQADVAKELHDVITPHFLHAGKWERAPIHRVLLTLTRRRPRDLIKLLYAASREAHRAGNTVISTDDLRATFENYSNERLQDIINEFKSEMPALDSLLKSMRPTKRSKKTSDSYTFTKAELMTKIGQVMNNVSVSFTNRNPVTAQSIASFLFKIDFVTARYKQDSGYLVRKYFDQNRFLQDQFFDTGYGWEIHPAYTWALQPEDVSTILNRLDLLE